MNSVVLFDILEWIEEESAQGDVNLSVFGDTNEYE